MKSQPRSIILAAAATALAISVLTSSAVAEKTPKPNANQSDSLSNNPSHGRRMDRLNDAVKISDLMGMTVKNLQDETLGDVDNILVDLSSGRLVAVVVSSGGFLGISDELSAVPPAAFRFSAERNALLLDTSKERLSNAPHFKANQWPDFAHTGYAAGVYRAYQVEPYFDATDAKTHHDSSGVHVRDRADRNLTAGDQGNSEADRNTTAAIRKEINAGSMSMNARNVKIVTLAGRVTLRGPVNTVDEKTKIGAIANRIARSENVDNQLEVVTSKDTSSR